MSKARILAVLCLIIALMIEFHHVAMGYGFWDWNQVIHHETAIACLAAFVGGLYTSKFITN